MEQAALLAFRLRSFSKEGLDDPTQRFGGTPRDVMKTWLV